MYFNFLLPPFPWRLTASTGEVGVLTHLIHRHRRVLDRLVAPAGHLCLRREGVRPRREGLHPRERRHMHLTIYGHRSRGFANLGHRRRLPAQVYVPRPSPPPPAPSALTHVSSGLLLAVYSVYDLKRNVRCPARSPARRLLTSRPLAGRRTRQVPLSAPGLAHSAPSQPQPLSRMFTLSAPVSPRPNLRQQTRQCPARSLALSLLLSVSRVWKNAVCNACGQSACASCALSRDMGEEEGEARATLLRGRRSFGRLSAHRRMRLLMVRH